MTKYLLRRLLATIPVLGIVSSMVFLMIHFIPGDPVIFMLRDQATTESIRALRHELRLDKPLVVQYMDWLLDLLHGEMGRSLITNEPVVTVIANAIGPTTQLAIFSTIVALAIGLSVGIFSAIRPRSALNTLSSVLSLLGICMPTFWTGIVLILVFAVFLRWLPPSGYVSFFENPVENLRRMILPSMCIGWLVGAVVMRQTRSAVIDVLHQEYIRVARAKGLSERAVTLRHVLKNALLPIVTVAGMELGALLGGAVVTETIFAIPGLGRTMTTATFSRNFPVVQGTVLAMAVAVVAANLLVDVLYGVLDPRIRHRASE